MFFKKYMNESCTFPDFLEYGFYKPKYIGVVHK